MFCFFNANERNLSTCKFDRINNRKSRTRVIFCASCSPKYFPEMIVRKRRSMYNSWPAEDRQYLAYCQDVTHFAKRFVDSAVTAAIRIVTVMVR